MLGPDNIAVPTGTATAGAAGNNYVKTSETADSPYGKITEQRKSTPGKVVKQSVSIVVDSAVKGVNLSSLQQSLTAAAGVDADARRHDRGDQHAVRHHGRRECEEAAGGRGLGQEPGPVLLPDQDGRRRRCWCCWCWAWPS